MSHEAYGDEQLGHLTIRDDNKNANDHTLVVEYSDRETFCDGVLDLNTKTIEGKVGQLVEGDEAGFWEPANTSTHRFALVMDETFDARACVREWEALDEIIELATKAVDGIVLPPRAPSKCFADM